MKHIYLLSILFITSMPLHSMDKLSDGTDYSSSESNPAAVRRELTREEKDSLWEVLESLHLVDSTGGTPAANKDSITSILHITPPKASSPQEFVLSRERSTGDILEKLNIAHEVECSCASPQEELAELPPLQPSASTGSLSSSSSSEPLRCCGFCVKTLIARCKKRSDS